MALVGAAGLLFNDSLLGILWDDDQVKPGTDIGFVTHLNKDVRRKHDHRIKWDRLFENDRIIQDDLVFAGTQSEAHVQLKDGSKIVVSPNSLVSFSQRKESFEMDLVYGSFRGEFKKESSFRLKGSDAQIFASSKDAEILIHKTSSGIETSVLSGLVEFSNQDQKRKINANQKLELNQGGEIKLKELKIKIKEPKFGAEIWQRPGKKTSFQWIDNNRKNSPYKIELFQKGKTVLSKQVQGSSVQMELPQNGDYRWRVVASDGSESPVFVLSYNRETRPTLVYPPVGVDFPISEQEDTRQVTFVFTDQTSGPYILQIANDQEFKESLVNLKIKSTRLENVPLSEGTYYWRVAAQDIKRPEALWSQAGNFAIKRAQRQIQPLSSTISIEIPNKNYPQYLYGASAQEVTKYLQESLDSEVIRFSEVENAEFYEFAISPFEKGQRTENNRPNFNFSVGEPGTKWVRARAKRPPGIWSAPVKVRTSLEPPRSLIRQRYKRKVKNGFRAKLPLKLQWTPILYAKSYEIQLSRNRQFTGAKKLKSKKARLRTGVFPDKKYYWRVRAKDENGQAISRYSKTFPVEIKAEFFDEPLPLRFSKGTGDQSKERLLAKGQRQPAAKKERRKRSRRRFVVKDQLPSVEKSRPRQGDYWLWAGTGTNFIRYEQESEDLNGFSFQSFKGPTILFEGGAGINKAWDIVASYKRTPGEISSSTLNIDKSSYTWQTMSAEGVYWFRKPFSALGKTIRWGLRGGLQYHLIPLLTSATPGDLNLQENAMTTASFGFSSYLNWSENIKFYWFMRYQRPILSSSSAEGFSLTPSFAFDGSVGASYRILPHWDLGLFWYGQWHIFDFVSSEESGSQSLFYSNMDLRLGYEF